MSGRTGNRMPQATGSRSWRKRAVVVVAVAALLSLSSVAWGAPPSTDRWCENFGSEFPELCYSALVPATGQTVSYHPYDDGDLQRGVEWPVDRFTINETDSGEPDGTVTDNLTGLIWLQNADCFGLVDWDLAIAAALVLNDGLCGLTDGSSQGDWRVPNIRELQSLIDYGTYDPALPAGHPFMQSGEAFRLYWSSTTRADSPEWAWFVAINDGGKGDVYKDYSYNISVWPVRGGQ